MQRIDWYKHILNNASLDDDEKLRMIADDMSEKICATQPCSMCSFTDKCYLGHIGVEDWLEEDVEGAD